jgi:hypothetical protein
LALALTVFALSSCEPTTNEPDDENTTTDPKIFKCKIRTSNKINNFLNKLKYLEKYGAYY